MMIFSYVNVRVWLFRWWCLWVFW